MIPQTLIGRPTGPLPFQDSQQESIESRLKAGGNNWLKMFVNYYPWETPSEY
jgi:hypothetical protein